MHLHIPEQLACQFYNFLLFRRSYGFAADLLRQAWGSVSHLLASIVTPLHQGVKQPWPAGDRLSRNSRIATEFTAC
jgi:hypothetical protein